MSDLTAFLRRTGWAAAEHHPLAGDASSRSYTRLREGSRTAMLMRVPLDHPEEALEPFIAVGRYLASLGLSVPHIQAVDVHHGLILLEDLGDDLFVPAISAGADEAALYAGATDVLALVHGQACPHTLPGEAAAHALPAFTPGRFQDEVDRVLDWYAPLAGGLALDADGYRAAWAPAWAAVLDDAEVFTQFDYHSPNLMWLPQRAGLKRIGVLDFQDSLRGPAGYDVVSLLQDPRRDLAPGLEDAMLARYLAARSAIDPARFRAGYAILGAQRAARILGTFARLWLRDGKSGYLKHQPRVWAHLERNLAHPSLAAVKAWFDTQLPPATRHLDWKGITAR
jgi:N-acetylmuramate 1-kinase